MRDKRLSIFLKLRFSQNKGAPIITRLSKIAQIALLTVEALLQNTMIAPYG